MENKNLFAKISAGLHAEIKRIRTNRKHRMAALVVAAIALAALVTSTFAFPPAAWIATTSTNCPSQLSGNTMVEVNNYLYVLGNSANPSFYRYNPAGISGGTGDCESTALANPPFSPIDGASMTKIDNDTIYVYLGSTGNRSIYIYKITANEWILDVRAKANDLGNSPALPQYSSVNQNNGNAILGVGNEIFMIEGNASSLFKKYNPSSNTWINLGNIATNSFSSMTAVGTTIYAVANNTTTSSFNSATVPGTWTTVSNATPGSAAFGAGVAIAAVGDQIYGLRGNNTSAFWRFNTNTNTWSATMTDNSTPLSPAPDFVRAGGSLVYPGTGDYLYAFQGNNQKNFWRYSLSGNTWSALAMAPAKVGSGGSLVAVNNTTLYATRGNSFRDFWRYDISTDQWTVMTSTPMDAGTLFSSDMTVMRGGLAFIPNGTSGAGEIFFTSGLATSTAGGALFRYPLTGTNANTWPVFYPPVRSPDTIGNGTSIAYPGVSAQDPTGSNLFILNGNGKLALWKFLLSYNTWIPWNRAKIDVNGDPNTPLSQTIPGAGTFQQGTGATMVEVNGKFYVIQGFSSRFHRFDPATNSWYKLADIPNANISSAATLVKVDNNTIYMLPGTSVNSQPELWRYDIPTDTWFAFTVAKKDDGTPIDQSGSTQGAGNTLAQVNGKFYVAAGGNSTFEKYDPVLNNWVRLADLPGTMGAGGAMTVSGTNIYAFLGGTSSSFYRYDTVANTWTSLTGLPSGTPSAFYEGAGSSLVYPGSGNFIYALKGYSNGNSAPNQQFWAYNISGNSWAQLTNTPQTIGGGAALTVISSDQNNIYAFGGEYTKNFWRYNIPGNTWNTTTTDNVTPLATPPDVVEAGATLSSDGTNIYATRGGGQKAVWKYTAATNTWSSVSSAPAKVGVACNVSQQVCANAMGGMVFYDNGGSSELWLVTGNGVTGTNTSSTGLDLETRGLIFRYKIATDTWPIIPRPASPPNSVGAGAALSYPGSGNYIYAFKGGSQRDFWLYDMSINRWRAIYESKNDDGSTVGTTSSFYTASGSGTVPYDTYRSEGAGNSIVEVQGKFYMLAGDDGGSFQKDAFFRYDPATNAWVKLANTPYDVYTGAALVKYDNNTIYAFKGNGGFGNYFWRYDIPSNTWISFNMAKKDDGTILANLPDSENYGNSIIQVGGKFYVFSGTNSSFYRYDPVTNTWTQLEKTVSTTNAGTTLVAANSNDIYVANTGSAFYKYDIGTNGWTTLTSGGFSGGPGQSLIYSGGFIYRFYGNSATNFQRYSIAGNSWTTMTAAPGTIYGGGSSALIGNNIYVLQGNNSRNFWRYNITNNRWNNVLDGEDPTNGGSTTLNDLAPSPVTGGGSLTTDGTYIYAVKGGVSDTFWRYNPAGTAGSRWTKMGKSPFKFGISTSTSSAAGGLTFYDPDGTPNNGDEEIWGVTGTGAGYGRTNSYDNEMGAAIVRYKIATDSWPYVEGPMDPPTPGSGASLAYPGTGNIIYAEAGNTANQFMTYDVSQNEWRYFTRAKLESGAAISEKGIALNGSSGSINAVSQGLGNNITSVNNIIYEIPGGFSNSFLKYDPATNIWSELDPFPTPSGTTNGNGSAMVPVGTNTIYAMKGSSSTEFYRYTISRNGWEQLANIPASVSNGGALGYPGGDFVYAFSGNSSTNFYKYCFQNTTTTCAINTWAAVTASGLTTVASGGSMTSVGGSIYAFPGNNTNNFYKFTVTNSPAFGDGTWTAMASPTWGTAGGVYAGGSLTNDGTDIYATRGNGTGEVKKYTVGSNTWSAMTSLPVNVGDSAGNTAGGMTYLTTGPSTGPELFVSTGTDSYNTSSNSNNGLLYRMPLTTGPNVNTWPRITEPADPPASFSTGGALVSPSNGSNKIYALRGSGTNDFWYYDITINEWNAFTKSALDNGSAISQGGTSQGAGNSIIQVGGNFYILAGNSTQTFQKYDPVNNTWTNLTSVPATISDGAAMASTDNDTIYVLRGSSSTTFYKYTISTNSWTTLGVTAANISYGGAITYPGAGDYLYAFGGGNTTNFYKYCFQNTTTTCTTNTWSAVTITAGGPIPANGGGAALVGVGGNFYSINGNNNTAFRKYVPNLTDGSVAVTTLANTPWTVLGGGSLTTDGTQIYVTRGTNTGSMRKYCLATDSDCTANTWMAADYASAPANIGINSATNARGGIAYVATGPSGAGEIYAVTGNGVGGNPSTGTVGLAYRFPLTAGPNALTWPTVTAPTKPAGVINGGGALATNGTDALYATAGGNTNTVYKYCFATGPNCGAGSNVWSSLANFPTTIGSTGDSRGGIVYTSSGTSGSAEIFVASGNGRPDVTVQSDAVTVPGRGLLFRMPFTGANANTWPTTATPPLPVTPASVGAGGSMTFVNSAQPGIYALGGNSTNNFWKFKITGSPNPGDGTWNTLTSPGWSGSVSTGGSIVTDGSGTKVWAMKGNTSPDLMRFDITGDLTGSWAAALTSAPVNLGISGNGGEMVYSNNKLWMTSGRGTSEYEDTSGQGYTGLLYNYDIAGNQWPFYYEAADAPTNATFTEGSDMVSTPDGLTIYALRGTRLNGATAGNPNFWKYTPSATGTGAWTALTNLRSNSNILSVGSGGSLAAISSTLLYATRGLNNADFYRFDANGTPGSEWTAQGSVPVGMGGTSTSEDRGELAYSSKYGAMFATPGNDTTSPYTIYAYPIIRAAISCVTKADNDAETINRCATGVVTPVANQSFGVQIQALDQNDQPYDVAAPTQITVYLKTGTGVLSGTVTGTISPGQNGVGYITGLLYNRADGGVVLSARDSTSPANITTLATSDSNGFTVNPAAPQILSLSPDNGPTGGRTEVTINSSGSNFYTHYVKTVTVNSSAALTDYQTLLTFDSASLISAGKMRSDCGDIRLTTTTGTTPYSSNANLLNYWLEPNSCNSTTTKIWVKIPNVSIGNNTFYMYYGDFRLSSASNGDNTFVFFDDFTGTTFNTTKWTKLDPASGCSNTYFSQNDKLFTSGGQFSWGCAGIYSNTNFARSGSLELETDFKMLNSGNMMMGWKDTTTGTGTNIINYTNLVHAFYWNGTGSDDVYEKGVNKGTSIGSQSWNNNQQYRLRVIMNPAGGAIYQRSSDNGSNWTTWMDTTTASPLTDSPLKIGFANYSGQTEIDNVKVRQYTATEPTATLGTETPTIGVTFGGSNAAIISFGANALSVSPPQHVAGPVDVVVTNSDNQSSTLAGGYTYIAPTITNISPDNGLPAGGTSVTITGTNFLPTRFRIPITINNASTSALTNYQASFSINTATAIAEGKMRSDGGDIRILDSDLSTPINNLWVENINSTSTKIWVKVPSIPASGSKTIYVTYGDSSLTSISSRANTFIREITGPTVVGSWSMDEGAGTTVTDTSGYSNTGTATGATIVAGKFGNARNFTGNSSQVVDAGNGGVLQLSGPITLESWVNVTAATSFPRILSKFSSYPYYGYELLLDSNYNPMRPYLQLGNAGSTYSVSSGVGIANGGWHHIVGTYNPSATTAKIYVDGVLQGTNSSISATALGLNTTDSLNFGRWPASGSSSNPLNGVVDEVKVYTGILNSGAGGEGSCTADGVNEVCDLYRNYGYTSPNYPGKVLVRKFQGITGTPQTEAISTTPGTEIGTNIPVTFDTNTATVSAVTSNSITLTTPAHATGTVTVTVTNAGDNATATTSFIYGVPPDVTSVVPNEGNIAGGETVDIYGTDFSNTPDPSHPSQNLEVYFGANPATSVNFIDSTHLTAVTPAAASTGTVNVRVVNPNTQSDTLTDGFTYITITDPGHSTVSASPTNNVEDDGVDSSTVTVTLLDSSLNPSNNKTVRVTASGAAPGTADPAPGASSIDAVDCTTGNSLGNIPANEAVSGADGKACFKVRTSPASARGNSGIYEFTATDITAAPITVTQTATVTFVDLIANKTNSTFTAPAGDVVADTVATKLLTATILNKNNVAVDGNSVSVSQTSGPAAATITALVNPTNGSGVATFTVATATAGTYTFQATASTGIIMDDPGDTVTVVFVAGSVDPNPPASTFSSDITTLAGDDSETAILTATLRDQFNNPVIDQTLNFTQISGTSTSTITPVFCPFPEPAGSEVGKSNENGKVCARVNANRAGAYNFEATDSSTFTLSQTVTLTFTGPTQNDSTISRYPTSVAANGVNASTITVTLTDAASHIFTGRTVTLTKSPGIATQGIDAVNCTSGASLGSGNTANSNGDGQACFKVHSNTQGTFTYQAVNTTEGSPTLSTPVDFVEGPIWTANGQAIANAQDDNSSYYAPIRTKVLRTNDGNYITIWTDNRDGSGQYSLFAQKYDSNGAAQWSPSTGVLIRNSVAGYNPYESQIITDGGNGAFITWIQTNNSTSKIELLGHHIDANGTLTWGASPVVILNATNGSTYSNENSGYDIIADGTGGAFIGYKDYNLSNYHLSVTRINSSGNIVTGDVESWPVRLGIGSTCTGGATMDMTLVRAGVPLVTYIDESDQLPYCNSVFSDEDVHMITLNSTDPADFIWESGPLNTRTNVHTDPDYSVYNCLYTNPVHGTIESKVQWDQRIITDGAGGAYTITKDDCHSGTTVDDHMIYVHYTSNSAAGPLYMWNYQLGQAASGGSAYYDVIPDGAGGVIIMYTANGQNGQVFIQRITNNPATHVPNSLWNGGTRMAVSNIGSTWKLVPGPVAGSAFVILPESGSAGTNVTLFNADGTIAGGYPKHIHDYIDGVPGVSLGSEYNTVTSQTRNAISDGSGGFVFVGEGTTNGFINAPFISDTDNFIQRVNSSGILQWNTATDVEVSPGVDIQSIAMKDQQDQQMVRLENGETLVAWRDNAKQQGFGSTFLGNINAIVNGGYTPVLEKIDTDGNPIWNTAGPGRGRIPFWSDGTNDLQNDQISLAPDLTGTTQNGGALIAWRRTQSTSYPSMIIVQKVNSAYDNYWLNWPANYYSGTPNGAQLAAGNNNKNPMIIADGAGGAFLTWIADSGSFPNSDVIVAKLRPSDGYYDATWGSNYKNITNTNSFVESNPKMIRSNGYLYIAYEIDNTTFGRAHDIYVAKINETNGTTVFASSLVAYSTTDERLLDVQPDRLGQGIIVLYSDNGNPGGKHRILAERINSFGNKLWNSAGPEGVLLSSTADDNLNARMTVDANSSFPTGQSGIIATWEQYNAAGTASDIAIQGVYQTGMLLWNPGRILSDPSQTVLKLNPQITADGSANNYPVMGAVVTWDQANGAGTQNYIYAQHVVNSISQWNTFGTQISNTVRMDQYPLIFGDLNGGANITWQGHSSPPDIFGQSIIEGNHSYNSTFDGGGTAIANGVDTVQVTATLLDQADVPVPNRTITVETILGNPGSITITPSNTVSPCLGDTAGVTNANGQACFLISSTGTGSFNFAATDTTEANNYMTITTIATAQFDPTPPTGENSSVVADPPSVPADGTISNVTVTLRDGNNNVVPGKDVSLAKSAGPGNPTITAIACNFEETPGVSNGDGQVCFTVFSTTVGIDTFEATDTTDNIVITQTADVTFTAGNPDPSTSNFTAFPASVGTNGQTSTLTATVRDANGNLVEGATVSVRKTSANGGTPVFDHTTTTTNSSGVATFAVSNATVGTDTYAASLDDINLVGGFGEQPVAHVVPGSGGTWTAVTPANDDDGTATVALPFTFNFFGTNYTTAYMCTNGYLQFFNQGGGCSYINSAFGSGDGIPRIAGYFLDLYRNTGTGSVMEYQTTANSIRFHWIVSNCCSGASNHEFEIDLFNDNHVELHYNDTSGSTASVVGVDSGAASISCTDTNNCIRSTLSGTNITTQSTQFALSAGGHPDIAQTADVEYYLPLAPPSICGFTQASAGYQSSYALRSNGTVWAWGSNGMGQLGNGTNDDSNVPVQVSGLTNITTVAGGDDHGLALRNDGTVWAWGANYDGQLGDGTNNDSNVPVQVSGLTNVTAIAGGVAHSLALRSDGTVWAWGDDYYGQLGNGANTDSNVPVQVSGLTNVTAISAGDLFSMALKDDGTVWTWGYGFTGLLGNGTNPASVNTPVQATITNVTAISGKDLHALALKDDGTVWGWGANNHGELGDGTNNDSNLPVMADITNVTSIVAAYGHSLAIRDDGTLWAWGFNLRGQLGNGNNTNSNLPVQVSSVQNIISVSGGYQHSIAISNRGEMGAWGYNFYGQLGDGGNTNTNVPVEVRGGQPSCITPNSGTTLGGTNVTIYGMNFQTVGTTAVTFGGTPATNVNVVSSGMITATTDAHPAGTVDVTVTNPDAQSTTLTNGFTFVPPPSLTCGLNADAIAGGNTHSLGMKDGNVAMWGTQQGLGSYHPSIVNGLTNISEISTTSGGGVTTSIGYSMALRSTDGTVWAWGSNLGGRLGDGTTTDSDTPVQVSGLTGITHISAGLYHAIALDGNGNVWAWGQGTSGQLGNGAWSDSSTPVQVSNLTGVTAISAGGNYSLALKSDGTVWAWGGNDSGKLGDGTTNYSNVPVQVVDPPDASGHLQNVNKIFAGLNHGLALKTNGTVVAWGYNGLYGELGNNSTTDSSVPVDVIGLTNITAIAAGGNHSLAIDSSGNIWAWGRGSDGQLGDGAFTHRHTPVLVQNLTNATAIAAGGVHSLALINNGEVWTWGSNTYGQLGIPTTTGWSGIPVQVSDATCNAIDPNVGPTSGGTAVTITGTNFQTGATVTFDGIPATGVTVVNSTTITATTPANAIGPADVTVTNPDNQSATLTDGFTYQTTVNAGSTIEASPASVPGDGTTASRITVTLLNNDSSPVVGHNVTVSQTGGLAMATITPVPCQVGDTAGVTNANGEACADVTFTGVAINTFGATDTTDNVTLTNTVDIEFTCAVGTPGVLTGTGGEQCAVIGITENSGALTITNVPASFTFPPSFPGGDSFSFNFDANDQWITVQDTRNGPGFTLQVQATTNFEDTGNPSHTIPLDNLYVATGNAPDGGTTPYGMACGGVSYNGPAYTGMTDCLTLTDPISVPLNMVYSTFSDLLIPANYTSMTGNTMNLPTNLMETTTGHNGSFTTYLLHYLHIPSTQDIGNYQVTLTFTAF